MDTRNIILATALSIGILLVWSVYFAPPPVLNEPITSELSESSDSNEIDSDLGLGSLDESIDIIEENEIYLFRIVFLTQTELRLILQEFLVR